MTNKMVYKLFAFLLSGLVITGAAAIAAPEHPSAYQLLKAAYQNRQTIPADFAGFDAKITYIEGNKKALGTLRYRAGKGVAIEMAGLDAADKKWVQHYIRSIIVHRTARDFDKSNGAHPLKFGQLTNTAPGKLIVRADDPLRSSRVTNGKISELVRQEGKWILTISIQETMPADAGKYLNTRHTVAYHDKDNGKLQKVNIFKDTYKRIGTVWLPASRQVQSFDQALLPRFRKILFEDIKLLK